MALQAEAISHAFRLAGNRAENNEALDVLEAIDLTVPAGSFVAIVGPSGCGKSSLLRILAGLIDPTAGRVLIGGAPRAGPDQQRAMVFQQPSLYPWLNVIGNIGFGLPTARRRQGRADQRVNDLINRIGLQEFADHRPASLSGGMAQRVALARALAGEPEMLLLDEPFASLDQQTREDMQDLLADFIATEGRAAVLVTHDIDEAIQLADRIYLMSPRPGRLVAEFQVSQPRPRAADFRTSDDLIVLKRDIVARLRAVVASGRENNEKQ